MVSASASSWLLLSVLSFVGTLEASELMTLCKNKCEGDCKVYEVPAAKCFSPKKLFPGDPQ